MTTKTNGTRKQLEVSIDEVKRLAQEVADSTVMESQEIVCGRVDRLCTALAFLKEDARNHRDFIVSHSRAGSSRS
jgi:hypothetical protein